jgi:excisionase family DNA binding protein
LEKISFKGEKMNLKTLTQVQQHLINPPPQRDRLFTVQEAAEMLRLPVTWLYERTRRDAVPHHKLGKYIRFTESDLSAIINLCSKGAFDNTPESRQEVVA